jgi:hypothetical protein
MKEYKLNQRFIKPIENGRYLPPRIEFYFTDGEGGEWTMEEFEAMKSEARGERMKYLLVG